MPKLPDTAEDDMWNIYNMKKNDDIHFEFIAFSKIMNILTSLYTCSNQEAFSYQPGNREHLEVLRTQEYIKNHYNEQIYLKDLAQMVGYSEDYLSKIFKRETGYTITEFCTKCRFDNAKTLLLQTTHAIKDIAAITGFSNPAYFNRQFKEKVGLTPSEFRKKRPF